MLVFNKYGLFTGLGSLNKFYRQNFYEKYVLLFDYLVLDLKKSVYLIKNKQLIFCKKVKGGSIFVKYYFLKRNLRVVLYLSGGYVFYSVTGGIVILRLLGRNTKIWRRERRGLGVIGYIIYRIRDKIKLVLKFFHIKAIKLLFCTYCKRFFAKRLFYKRIWYYLKNKKYVYDRIPRSHNSLDSGKRWRKRPTN